MIRHIGNKPQVKPIIQFKLYVFIISKLYKICLSFINLQKWPDKNRKKMSDPPVKRYRREPSPKSDLEASDDDDGYVPYVSVGEQHKELQEVAEEKKETMAEKQKKEEEEILARIGEATALKGVAKLETGVVYTESIKTSWKAPCFDKTGTITDGGSSSKE